jgi:hypothetical protein
VAHATESGPSYRSHYLPRTRVGGFAVALFIVLFVLAEPPLVFALANRIEPWLLGMPFLYVYLLAVYAALIGVLVWARRRGL